MVYWLGRATCQLIYVPKLTSFHTMSKEAVFTFGHTFSLTHGLTDEYWNFVLVWAEVCGDCTLLSDTGCYSDISGIPLVNIKHTLAIFNKRQDYAWYMAKSNTWYVLIYYWGLYLDETWHWIEGKTMAFVFEKGGIGFIYLNSRI